MTTIKVCVDCYPDPEERKLARVTGVAISEDGTPRKARPAPHPGPRCATHNRMIRKQRKARAHDKRVQGEYGLYEGEYEELLRYQGGKCAGCRRATGATRRLSVDHHHASGCVRMALCRPCNTILGHGRDDPSYFRRMARLLESPPAIEILGYRGGDEMEYWKEIPGYDGWYEASTMGRIRSWKGAGNNGGYEAPRRDDPLVLKQSPTRGDYLFVNLCRNGEITSYRVNRLILITFEGDEPELQACHKNGDRQDNRLSNLYWGTAVENMADMERHGRVAKGEVKAEALLTEDDVMRMRRLWASDQKPTAVRLGEMFGVSGPTAWKAATGKTWTHLPMPEVARD
jgi:hypothetical protein